MARITLTICDTRIGPVYRWNGLPPQLTPALTHAEVAAFKFARELDRVLAQAVAPPPSVQQLLPVPAHVKAAMAEMVTAAAAAAEGGAHE